MSLNRKTQTVSGRSRNAGICVVQSNNIGLYLDNAISNIVWGRTYHIAYLCKSEINIKKRLTFALIYGLI